MVLLVAAALAADIPVPAGSNLAAAVAAANDGDRLLLAAGDHPTTGVSLDGRALTLIGEGATATRLIGAGTEVLAIGAGVIALAELTIDASGARRGIDVGIGELTLDAVVVRGGSAPGGGGGLRVDGGSVVATGGRFDTNDAVSQSGGHVALLAGSLSATGTVFVGGRARRGAGVYAASGAMSFDDCVFEQNQTVGAQGRGAAIYATGAEVSVVGGTFEANTAGLQSRGGAIAVEAGATLDVTGARFSANTAVAGGAVACDASSCALVGARLDGNQATTGGAITAQGAELRVEDVVLCDNAATSGGAIELVGGDATVRRTWLLDNTASASGGAIAAEGPLRVENATLLDNASASGPALSGAGVVELVNVAIAWSVGAGPAVAGASVSARHVLWFENDADGLPLGDPHVLADPLYPADGRHTCDPARLVPPVDSPLVDAGDPALVDPDGSPSDIGAGPPQARPDPCEGLPIVAVCPDADGDTHGDPSALIETCAPEPGFVSDCDDCDDADPARWQGAHDAQGALVCDVEEPPIPPVLRYGTGCSEARGCSGGAAWLIVLPFPWIARRRR